MSIAMERVFLLLLLVWPAAVLAGCVELENVFNAEYVTPISVGGQSVVVAPDSGSLDLVVPSVDCVSPGCAAHARVSKATGYTAVNPGKQTSVAYGQGDVVAEMGETAVTVGDASGSAVPVRLITEEALAGYAAAAYDGVLGMGMHERSPAGGSSLLAGLGLSSFGVCLGQEDGSAGRLDVGGPTPGKAFGPAVRVAGDVHWALELSSLTVGGASVGGGGAMAVVDSGSSLLTVPTAVLERLYSAIGVDKLNSLQAQHQCEGTVFDSLPELRISMGGVELPLRPAQYMASMNVSIPPLFQGRDDLHARVAADMSGAEGLRCVPLFMNLDTKTQDGKDVVVVGMPFFRAYAVHFDRGAKTLAFAPNAAGQCHGCGGAKRAAAAAVATTSSRRGRAQQARGIALLGATRDAPEQNHEQKTLLPARAGEGGEGTEAARVVSVAAHRLRLPGWAMDPRHRPRGGGDGDGAQHEHAHVHAHAHAHALLLQNATQRLLASAAETWRVRV